MIQQNFLKKLWKGKKGEWIHQLFARYFKGQFKGPQLTIERKKKIIIQASVPYVNILGELLAQLSSGEFLISGNIYSKHKIKPELPIKGEARKRKWKGEALKVKGKVGSEKLLAAYRKFKSAWFLLKFKAKMGKLKTKFLLPQRFEKDRKFCKATYKQECFLTLREELCFPIKEDFRKAEISHRYHIEKLEIPKELKGKWDEARRKARRKGKIERKIKIDGREKVFEKQFEI